MSIQNRKDECVSIIENMMNDIGGWQCRTIYQIIERYLTYTTNNVITDPEFRLEISETYDDKIPDKIDTKDHYIDKSITIIKFNKFSTKKQVEVLIKVVINAIEGMNEGEVKHPYFHLVIQQIESIHAVDGADEEVKQKQEDFPRLGEDISMHKTIISSTNSKDDDDEMILNVYRGMDFSQQTRRKIKMMFKLMGHLEESKRWS
jgi:hypothetical protein